MREEDIRLQRLRNTDRDQCDLKMYIAHTLDKQGFCPVTHKYSRFVIYGFARVGIKRWNTEDLYFYNYRVEAAI